MRYFAKSTGWTWATRFAAVATVALLSIGSARAVYLSNAGFETGDTAGWTASDPTVVSVVSTFTSPLFGVTSGPCCNDSRLFAVIGAEDNISGDTLSQTIHMTAGESLSHQYVRFISDFVTIDSATVQVLHSSGAVVGQPFSDTESLGSSSPWTLVNFTAPTTDDFTFNFTVFSGAAGAPPTSFLLIDAPEPAGLALIAVGLSALGLARRRR